jgi:hypothetical protein
MNAVEKLLPVFLRRESARSTVPFERFDPPVREGSAQWKWSRDPKLQALAAQIRQLKLSAGLPSWRQYPRHVCPEDGDIVGYLDEQCTDPLFRYHWWQLPPSERRKLTNLSFKYVGTWDPIESRRKIVWLPPRISAKDEGHALR